MSPKPLRPGVSTAIAAFATLAAVVGTLSYLDVPSLLTQRKEAKKVSKARYNPEDTPSLLAFKALVVQETLSSTYPLASTIERNIPIYDARSLDLHDAKVVEAFQDEVFHILYHGPGVLAMKNFVHDLSIIDAANAAFTAIINREAEAKLSDPAYFGTTKYDKTPNAWISNSFSKLCLQDPETFMNYFSNALFPVICSAYLGPQYKITAQVNAVRPGGKPQHLHRDYHLGFPSREDVAKFPKQMHELSRLLTMQGAVAHADMPAESGPTRFLPYSQGFGEGYMATGREEFKQYFAENYVSLPLQKGDALFFSPGLFHGAGENVSQDVDRMAHLFQVSCAMGKTMESIDSHPLIEATYDLLTDMQGKDGRELQVDAFVQSVAEGYPFPSNPDKRKPVPGSKGPESEQQLLKRAISGKWEKARLMEELTSMKQACQAST
ncbi:hypothetical protein LTR95_004633 [Oleoguttula sp. CCFEE 5521]